MFVLLAIGATLAVLFVLRLMIAVRRFKLEQPMNERNWVNDNAQLTRVTIDGNTAHLVNVRDFRWRTTTDYDERWVERTVRIDQVSRIWLVLEYFEPDRPEIAHTLLSFEFEDGQRLACSIEVRREQGERQEQLRSETGRRGWRHVVVSAVRRIRVSPYDKPVRTPEEGSSAAECSSDKRYGSGLFPSLIPRPGLLFRCPTSSIKTKSMPC